MCSRHRPSLARGGPGNTRERVAGPPEGGVRRERSSQPRLTPRGPGRWTAGSGLARSPLAQELRGGQANRPSRDLSGQALAFRPGLHHHGQGVVQRQLIPGCKAGRARPGTAHPGDLGTRSLWHS
jgi:hypothetical protein